MLQVLQVPDLWLLVEGKEKAKAVVRSIYKFVT